MAKPTLLAIDVGNGKDWTVEVEYCVNPDGSRTVLAQRAYHTTIDAKAVSDFTRVCEKTGMIEQLRKE